mgnify:CR=1 FL=1
MQILARCPKCDAGLAVRADEAPAAIKCGGCGRELALDVSDALKADRAVDRCPACGGGDFYIRKDFDPKLGLTVVIIGALISAGFYWFGRDLIAYGILASAALIDLVAHGRLKGSHRLLSLPLGIPRHLHANRGRLRSPHRRRARAGARAADRQAINAKAARS